MRDAGIGPYGDSMSNELIPILTIIDVRVRADNDLTFDLGVFVNQEL
jgi:hypothetical protein